MGGTRQKIEYCADYLLYRVQGRGEKTTFEVVSRSFRTPKAAAKHLQRMCALTDEGTRWISYPSLVRKVGGECTGSLPIEEDNGVLSWFLAAPTRGRKKLKNAVG